MNTVRNEEAGVYTTSALVKTNTDELYNHIDKAIDDSIISKALEILDKRIRKNPVELTSAFLVKDFLRLRLQRLEHEELHVLFLDNQHRLISCEFMFRGTLDSCSIPPREVVKRALQLNAAALIVAHNHPSGVAEPSSADKSITNKLKDALALVDIRLLDHFIVGETMYSFAEAGLI